MGALHPARPVAAGAGLLAIVARLPAGVAAHQQGSAALLTADVATRQPRQHSLGICPWPCTLLTQRGSQALPTLCRAAVPALQSMPALGRASGWVSLHLYTT